MTDALLEALRDEGLHGHDPARFHYLEVLARRLPGQPPAVRQALQQRWDAAVADYALRARSAPAQPVAEVAGRGSPLAQLNRELHAHAGTGAGPGLAGHGGGGVPDLPSVRRFGEVWSKIAAEQQVAQALVRGPENAGPLNSHKLVLRSLRLMRALSPAYLQRFMAQMDALLWLEQRLPKAAPPTAKPARKGRRKT
ncbi:DUF2894 domain-containing protein [Simplicispira lacusdiani]|uniref:DUF2894 domain-containing protein n=1 Tax=Simplicispira lacusdiani TaxID=2213010 RepID=UPI000E73942C|nr:DUF2894 domain-containing protein [Simplicispira lacusdiani]